MTFAKELKETGLFEKNSLYHDIYFSSLYFAAGLSLAIIEMFTILSMSVIYNEYVIDHSKIPFELIAQLLSLDNYLTLVLMIAVPSQIVISYAIHGTLSHGDTL